MSAPVRPASTCRAASIGSPTGCQRPSVNRMPPPEHSAADMARSWAAAKAGPSPTRLPSGTYPSPATCTVPPGVHTSTATGSPRVSSPVWWTHRNVAAPSRSVASGRRVSVSARAIRCAVQARQRLTAGSRPSGTRATAAPTAGRKPAEAGTPNAKESRSSSRATPAAAPEANVTRSRRSRVSGPEGRRAWRSGETSWPSRVHGPVVTTTPSASPATTWVPANTVSPSPRGAAVRRPVSGASSTASPCASVRRRSAGTRSPAPSSTTSPRTRSVASTRVNRPSRTTVAAAGTRARTRCLTRSAQ